jgi:SAM-dependent methyltransferase
MDERFHSYQVGVEDWHWWYKVRRQILDVELARLSLPPDARLLDVGCGTGGASLVLSKYGRAVGLDVRTEAFRLSSHRPWTYRVASPVADHTRLPFKDNAFDVACALDVLEHLDDDAGAARELARVVKPGGTVIVFVPAFQILWGYNDDFSHHKRRYRRSQIAAVLKNAGLEIRDSGYFNGVLFAPTLAARLLQRVLPSATEGMEHGDEPSRMNGVLERVFALEVPLLRRGVSLPFGTSAWVVAHKR